MFVSDERISAKNKMLDFEDRLEYPTRYEDMLINSYILNISDMTLAMCYNLMVDKRKSSTHGEIDYVEESYHTRYPTNS